MECTVCRPSDIQYRCVYCRMYNGEILTTVGTSCYWLAKPMYPWNPLFSCGHLLYRVGKTELCKALAAYMFDTEEAMVSTVCLWQGTQVITLNALDYLVQS